MIREILVFNPPQKARNCIVALAGRSGSAGMMSSITRDLCFEQHTAIIAARPYNYAWYPQPVSSQDQAEAVAGLAYARGEIEQLIEQYVQGLLHLQKKDTVLLGFSAGAVMAIQVGIHSDQPFKGIVAFAGAILEPDAVPQCQHPHMPILLQHNQDDSCFDWDERYLPMKNTLLNNGYEVHPMEGYFGGHQIDIWDVVKVSQFLGPRLGYGKNWQHPKLTETDNGEDK